MGTDPLDEIIRRVLELAGADVTLSTRVEPAMRQEYGGERYYFGKTPKLGKMREAGPLVAAGLPPVEIAARLRVTERWVYKLLGSKWSVR